MAKLIDISYFTQWFPKLKSIQQEENSLQWSWNFLCSSLIKTWKCCVADFLFNAFSVWDALSAKIRARSKFWIKFQIYLEFSRVSFFHLCYNGWRHFSFLYTFMHDLCLSKDLNIFYQVPTSENQVWWVLICMC